MTRTTDDACFPLAPSRNGTRGLVTLHEKTPVALYDSAGGQLGESMGARGGGGAKNPESTTQWTQYLQSVLQQQCRQENMPAERVQELRTLCEALNLARTGKVRGLCDLLAQLFLAVEQKALGQRNLARGLELVQTRWHGLSSQGTLRQANKAVIAGLKMAAQSERLRGRR